MPIAMKKVKVCKNCSKIDLEELFTKIDPKDCTTGCIGQCKKNPGKIAAYIEGELMIFETKEDFYTKISSLS